MQFQNPQGHKRDRRMKPRFLINIRAKIRVQLIGSSSPLEFVAENISENGLLLDYMGKERLIFNQSTILETWLDINESKPIFFVTKFVRYHSENRVAIRIIDIDNDTHERYLRFIEESATDEVE
ncbi:MAG: PilZ domain-containing protein [Oligoflexus sp.]